MRATSDSVREKNAKIESVKRPTFSIPTKHKLKAQHKTIQQLKIETRMTIFFGISSASSSISKFRYIVVFGNLDHSSESYSGVTQCDCPACDLRSRRANSV